MSTRKSKRLSKLKKDNFDEETKNKMAAKRIDNLHRDNYQEDPHGDLDPKLSFRYDGIKGLGERKFRMKKCEISEYFKTRFRKSFDELVSDDSVRRNDSPNYSSAKAPPSNYPMRKFCEVCGFVSKYNCTACNARYCSLNCLDVHKDTRCLKYVV